MSDFFEMAHNSDKLRGPKHKLYKKEVRHHAGKNFFSQKLMIGTG